MKTARIIYSNNDVIITNINGTEGSIKEYYKIGKVFNLGSVEDNMQSVVSCEILKTFKFSFVGRLIGSIGKSYKCFKTIEAYTCVEAELKLYDTHEHITDLNIFVKAKVN
jgi:hypothetical protein